MASDLSALSSLLRVEQGAADGHSVQAAKATSANAHLTPADLARAGGAGKADEAESKAAPKSGKAIWDEEDVPELADVEDEHETRPRPTFDIVMKQRVGTEDVYLGLSDVDNSSTHCGFMVVKVDLPGEKLANVDLDVTKQKIKVSANKFYLSTYLPYPVRHKDGKAKWIRDKERLEVTLPIIRAEW